MKQLWIVPNCPDFYFMPVTSFDQVFTEYDTTGDKFRFWKCPKYWQDKGWDVQELEECSDEEANVWISQKNLSIYRKENKADVDWLRENIEIKAYKIVKENT